MSASSKKTRASGFSDHTFCVACGAKNGKHTSRCDSDAAKAGRAKAKKSASPSKRTSPKLQPARPATRKPKYWESVAWIIKNDGSAADALAGLPEDPNQAVTNAALSAILTVGMLADMYGIERSMVAIDIIRTYAQDTQS